MLKQIARIKWRRMDMLTNKDIMDEILNIRYKSPEKERESCALNYYPKVMMTIQKPLHGLIWQMHYIL